MKKLLLSMFCVLFVLGSYASAQEPVLSLQGALIANTVLVASTDTSQKFTTAFNTAYGSTVDWSLVRAVTITCETYDARISFGVAAENDGSPVGHILAVSSSARFVSRDLIEKMYFISKTAGSAAALMVTLEK